MVGGGGELWLVIDGDSGEVGWWWRWWLCGSDKSCRVLFSIIVL